MVDKNVPADSDRSLILQGGQLAVELNTAHDFKLKGDPLAAKLNKAHDLTLILGSGVFFDPREK